MERIITPGVFWRAGSWNLREQDIKKLQACQNTMHRMIVGIDNVDHAHLDAALKKAYHEVHHWRISANIETWTQKLSQRRFRWAGHVACMNDNRPSVKILMWRSSAWLNNKNIDWEEEDKVTGDMYTCVDGSLGLHGGDQTLNLTTKPTFHTNGWM